MVAHKMMHCFEAKKKKDMAVKLDMYKAYDKVECLFVRNMLTALRFPEKWTNFILECISTVTYSIQINGQAEGEIKLTRRL